VKIMLLYLLIGTGMNLSVGWMTDAENIAANASPAMSALEIMGASIIFMMLCWQIPKLFAAVLGGSPALSGGDLVSSGAFVAGGAIALGSAALGAAGSAAGLLSAGATAGGGTTGTSSPPAMLASAGSSGGGSGTVPPPASPSTSPAGGSSQPSAPMSDAARNLSGMHRRIASRFPPDSGPHATPPRLNIDQNE
jgi:type IV secretory pathway TrbL component